MVIVTAIEKLVTGFPPEVAVILNPLIIVWPAGVGEPITIVPVAASVIVITVSDGTAPAGTSTVIFVPSALVKVVLPPSEAVAITWPL